MDFFCANCSVRACRISILLSIARVANPSQRLRRIMFLVGCSFVVMWAALLGQKIHVCVKNGCIMTFSIGVSLLFSQCPSHSRVHAKCLNPRSRALSSKCDFRFCARRFAYLSPPKDKDYSPTADHDTFGVLCVVVNHCGHYFIFCRSLHWDVKHDHDHRSRQGKSYSILHSFSRRER